MRPVAYATGWAAAAALGAAILVPASGRVFRRRHPLRGPWVRWHAWLGGGAALVGTGHSIASITDARLPPGPEAGLWVASAAAALLVIEALIGVTLRDPFRVDRQARRYHLAIVCALVLLVAVHVTLDGPVP